MKKNCCQCGRRVYVLRFRQEGARGQLDDHDLCGQCYRAMRNQIVAQRQGVKPWWAVKISSGLTYNQ